MHVDLSLQPSIHLSVYLSIYVCNHHLSVHLFILVSIHQSIQQPLYLSIYLSFYPPRPQGRHQLHRLQRERVLSRHGRRGLDRPPVGFAQTEELQDDSAGRRRGIRGHGPLLRPVWNILGRRRDGREVTCAHFCC